jgi:hypothetical protein
VLENRSLQQVKPISAASQAHSSICATSHPELQAISAASQAILSTTSLPCQQLSRPFFKSSTHTFLYFSFSFSFCPLVLNLY